MLVDFAVPLCLLMFAMPCFAAVYVMQDKTDRFEKFMGPGFDRATLVGMPRHIIVSRMGIPATA